MWCSSWCAKWSDTIFYHSSVIWCQLVWASRWVVVVWPMVNMCDLANPDTICPPPSPISPCLTISQFFCPCQEPWWQCWWWEVGDGQGQPWSNVITSSLHHGTNQWPSSQRVSSSSSSSSSHQSMMVMSTKENDHWNEASQKKTSEQEQDGKLWTAYKLIWSN